MRIDQDELRARVKHDGGRGGVRVSRDDRLVAGAEPQDAERHLRAGGLGVKANALFHPDRFGDIFFQLFGSRARRDPSGSKRGGDLLDFKLGDIGRTKRNTSLAFGHRTSSFYNRKRSAFFRNRAETLNRSR